MITNSQQLKKERGINENAFKRRLKYNLKQGKLFKLRKGLYSTVPIDQLQENEYLQAGSLLYTPSYLSYESVLQAAGIVHQYHSILSFAGPYTRTTILGTQHIAHTRLPRSLLTHPLGIVHKHGIAQATPERAICDILYHNPHYPLDHLPESLDIDLIQHIAQMHSHTRGQKHLPQIVLGLFANTNEKPKNNS